MVGVAVVLQKIGVNVELGVEVKTMQVKHFFDRHLAKMHGFLRCARVHVLQAVLQSVQGIGIHQIAFADENLIGKANLAARLLAVVELQWGVLGVHQSQNGVEQIGLGHFIVHEEGLGHRAGVGQAGGFDHQALKVKLALAPALGQVAQGGAQVFADGATHTAIAHLNDLLVGVGHQDLVVDVFFAKFVFNHGDFHAVGLGQHPLEQGGFARAQKTGQDSGGDQHGLLSGDECTKGGSVAII